MASGKAVVKGVISGDTIVIVGSAKAGASPPTMQLSLASIVAPKMAMRSLNRDADDEPYGFEARELVRKLVVGQTVEFSTEYEFRGRTFGRVCINGQNIAIALLKAGLARLLPKPREGSNHASDYEELEAAQQDAIDNGVGVHGAADSESVRRCLWAAGDDVDISELLESNKNKLLNAQIESIRDGGCYRIMILPGQLDGIDEEAYFFTPLHLSGIQCAKVKLDEEGNEQAEPFAMEAKHFTEMRLLNREVQVRLESKDTYNNLFGSIIHPNGNIAVSMLKHGFARVADWSIRHISNPGEYRAAQKEAQSKNLRRWRDFVPSTMEKKDYVGKVIEVHGGDCIVVKDPEGNEKRLYMSSLRCPRLQTRVMAADGSETLGAEDWAWESKEFCRRQLVGKKVNVSIEYQKERISANEGVKGPPPSDESGMYIFASIYLGTGKEGKEPLHLGTALCAAGLGQTMFHRMDDNDRSQHYDEMVAAEEEAKSKKLGVHADKKPPRRMNNDLCGPTNAIRAQAMKDSMIRLGKFTGIVDYVFNGSRFKIHSPKEQSYFFLTLGGATCPQTARPNDPKSVAEPFANEARLLAREHIMQHEVTVQVVSCNRGGTFIGSLWCKIDNKEVNFGEYLVEHGYASTAEYLDFMPNAERLRELENKAYEKKLRLWSIEENRQVQEAAVTTSNKVESMGKVQIVHINSFEEFFVQPTGSGSKVDRIIAEIADVVNGKAGPLAGFGKGTLCLAQFSADKQWYRARIEGRVQGGVKVTFIDFGNGESVAMDKLKSLPASLSLNAFPAQAIKVALNLLTTSKEYQKYCCELLQEWADEGPLDCTSERMVTGKKMVILKPASGLSVNEEFAKEGLCFVDTKQSSSIKQSLEELVAVAKKDRLNLWEHGDIQEDDENEGGYW